MRAICHSMLCLFVLAVCARLCAEQPGPPAASGWRGDGSGHYPNANPPLNWGRQAKSVKELSAQACKPKDGGLPAKESAIPDGVIRQWLVLGPLPIPDGAKAEDLLPEAVSLEPNEGDKTGDQAWRAVKTDTNCVDLCSAFNLPEDKAAVAAYALAYLYSPSGQPVVLNALSQGQGYFRIWLNGKEVYFTGKAAADMDFLGARAMLQLQKGWNRLLLLNSKTLKGRKSWWFVTSLYGESTTEYETQGIAWMTPLPNPGSSAPVIMGDRIFFTAEGGSLVCANKADGKLLWIRSLTLYDFATEEDRKAHPEVFAELDPLAAKLKEIDQSETVMPWKMPALEKDFRWCVETPLVNGMLKAFKDKFSRLSWGYDCEAGYTPFTPVTDGQHVYVVYGAGIAACFDRDGNCVWKTLLKLKGAEHWYTSSPLLVDGKLIVYLDNFVELDAKTGKVIVERPHYAMPKKDPRCWQLFGTGCLLPAGKETVLFYPNDEFVRLADGKTLPFNEENFRPKEYPCVWTSPVTDKGVCYMVSGIRPFYPPIAVLAFKLPAPQGGTVAPEVVKKCSFTTDKFPYYYESHYCASPLFHEGLLYCLDDFGVLTVLDMEKGAVACQKQLDLEIFMPYNGGLLKGGASSSPTLAGKYIYIWGNQGTCVVLEPGRAFKQVARNRIENYNSTSCRASPLTREATITNPVFEGERMYFRAQSTLYCIGNK